VNLTDIFLSYNREDQARAKLFADAFTAAGLSVWWDTALRSGEAYDEVTEAALRAAKAVVVLWSPRSVVSRWVRAEATIADRCKTLVPVTIEPCERPIMFELTQTAELSHWSGDVSDRAWLAFLDDVRRMAVKADQPQIATPSTAVAPPTVAETLKPGQSGSAPSLAVLPFINRSSLPEDEVLAEGMVEDLTSALSQGVNVRVLGATATANLSRAAITDLAALGRQLDVRYLLEGNVRRVGANLRVTTQLLEAATGEIVWTGKFDRPLSELAELQEELVTDIAASLDAQVYSLEMERALKKPGDITAWEAVVRSTSAYRKWDEAARATAIEEARRAVSIAPNYAPALSALAYSRANAYHALPDDPTEVLSIRANVERALVLAPDDASVLAWAGLALCLIGNPDEAERHTRRAVRKAPGSAIVHYAHGVALYMLNQPEEALSHFKAAERLAPGSHMMWIYITWQSAAFRDLGRLAEAEAARDQSIDLNPGHGFDIVYKAVLCVLLGRQAEGRRLIETAGQFGWGLAQTERTWCRAHPNSPTLESDIAIIRELYAEAEPGA
jgi:TolB-like protein